MNPAEKYNEELERLLQETEEKARLADSIKTKSFIKRAAAVKLTAKKMLEMWESAGFDSVVAELLRREKGALKGKTK